MATLPPGKYVDGEGLVLVVAAPGLGKWVMRSSQLGKRREMGLETFAGVSLAEARAEADKANATGVDPIAHRKASAPVAVPSFWDRTPRYIEDHRAGWRSAKQAGQWEATIRTYAKPVIGALLMDRVTTDHVLRIPSLSGPSKPKRRNGY